ncbi:flagellar type III secretion system pore protein FliP [Endozoicomonas ascidiicola]|uniref:flagellar type III secretion system pore protein FliP n=1 Tax=Endozoicomonas ascidiicola TaxID=1698521 RepID=UPI00082DC259|nr:flagellar type III secretion system pore protein FliP [Endozoicomonas ascidiicola]
MNRRLWLVFTLLPVVLLAIPLPGLAESGLPLISITNDGDTTEYSASLQILILMTALSFIPAALLMMTSFTRIIIVMAILRQAMGLQQTPPNQVLLGITLALTLLIMTPLFETIYAEAITPYLEESYTLMEALKQASIPVKDFMLKQTRETDLQLFYGIANKEIPQNIDSTPLSIAIPAFVTSELKTAFQIGFIIYIPFLVIDLVVASVLMAMGMIMLSPQMISLPFKLMLFVLVDGWAMIMGTMASSFF